MKCFHNSTKWLDMNYVLILTLSNLYNKIEFDLLCILHIKSMESLCSTIKNWINCTKERRVHFEWKIDQLQRNISDLEYSIHLDPLDPAQMTQEDWKQLQVCDRKHRELNRELGVYNNELWVTEKELKTYSCFNELFKCPKE